MADAAEFAFQEVIHGEMPGGFLFYVEGIRMTVVAVEPGLVSIVGKDCRGDLTQFRFQQQGLVERHIWRSGSENAPGHQGPVVERL